ncbi:MAG: hypothetical protein LBK61_07745 [Spirochaetaceae bacterium]|nr:hypothetical protein [Spirochaetaceae bacterium]
MKVKMTHKNFAYRNIAAGHAVIFIAALFFMVTACDTETPDFQTGPGIVQVNLASASSGTAASLASVHDESASQSLFTILPSGLVYTITFSAAGKTPVTTDVTTSAAEETLDPGLWQVKAEAKLSGGNKVAEGSGEVQVIAGRTVQLNIALAPVENSGTGTFEYTINNVTPSDYTIAKMDIVDLKNNSTKVTADFKGSGALSKTDAAYAAGYYRLRLTFEKKTAAMAVLRAVKTEIIHIYDGATTAFTQDANNLNFAYLPAPVLFFDHGTRITDADTGDWDERNTYHVAANKPVVLAPVIANAPPNAVYEWYIDNVILPTESGEYLEHSFPAASMQVQVKVAMKVDAVTHASASTLVKAVTPVAVRTGGSKAEAADCIEFSPAPGQFVGKGNGFSNPVISGLASKTEAEVKDIVQDYMDGNMSFKNESADGKVFSLGGWGGYYTVYFDHSVPNESGADIEISGNHHVAGMNEPGIVWVSQDLNGDGIPNEIWYRLKGTHNAAKPRYAVTYFKPASKATAFWIDNNGQSEGFSYYSDGDNGFPYHITGTAGTFVTFAGVLLNDNGNLSGYVDSGSTKFDIADAVDENGDSVPLTHIDFVKIQTALNKNGGGLGEYSTEAGIPKDLHFETTP